MGKPETMMIDDVKYVREDSINTNAKAESVDGLEYCLIRCYAAGVHIGFVKKHNGENVILLNSRRLFYWTGACSVTQVSIDGVDVKLSKIAMVLPEVRLTGVAEVIPMSRKAADIILGAPVWKK